MNSAKAFGLAGILFMTVAVVPTSAAGELAPTGTLRAIFLGRKAAQGRVDPVTGAVSGPAVELAHALAGQLGLATTFTAAPGMAEVMDGVRAGRADIGFLAIDPARASQVSFSRPYALAHNTYLVSARSAVHTVADVDRPGTRIAVGAGDAADLFLGRTLKHAQISRVPPGSGIEALQLLSAGRVDAFAANRQRLIELAQDRADLHILADNFLAVAQAIIVAKGNGAGLDIVDRFLDEARMSGFIQMVLDRAGLSGVEVAPALVR